MDRPGDQNDEYPPFAIHPQAVLSSFWLSAEPASLRHAQRQLSPFSGADNKKCNVIKNTIQKEDFCDSDCGGLKDSFSVCPVVCWILQNVGFFHQLTSFQPIRIFGTAEDHSTTVAQHPKFYQAYTLVWDSTRADFEQMWMGSDPSL